MGMPPKESIKPCRARSRSVLALNASRSINASAAVVWMKPGIVAATVTLYYRYKFAVAQEDEGKPWNRRRW